MSDSPTQRGSQHSLTSEMQVVLATVAGLALRLVFVLRFPAGSGDGPIYQELARNWVDAHIYGVFTPNGLVSSDIRGPGYPALLALVYLLFGRGQTPILLAQVLIDLCTCYLVALAARRLAPEAERRRTGLAALWLAVTCPFVANYAAVSLTEVLATFLTAAALIPLLGGCNAIDSGEPAAADAAGAWRPWFAGGLLAGLGTLVRPETPLLLAALALVLGIRLRRRADWGRLARAGLAAAVGLMLPLAPWAARNWVRFHEVQFLAPRYAQSPGEFVPRGLYAWTDTWLARYRDVYLVPWKVDGEPIEMDDIPAAAFDSAEEKARVAALVAAYNDELAMSPEVDAGFAELARERTARRPLRTYVEVPAERAVTMWFTPRIELLPYSGRLQPFREARREDRVDVSVTLGLFALGLFYAALALVGLARGWRRGPPTALALAAGFIVVRTMYLTTVETPEPRYTLECFPALLAMGALAFARRRPRES